MKTIDVVIIGAGAAGLMCAIEAARRGRQVLMLDRADKIGKKILMSGGGRCNFTNYHVNPTCYISHNPQFCISALMRYTPWDFIKLVQQYQIPFHEKTLGQLFCDNKAKDILTMLLTEATKNQVVIECLIETQRIDRLDNGKFKVCTDRGNYICQSLVIATGGLSIPTMGSSPFGYQVAEHFGIKVWPLRAGLVPLTLQPEDKARLSVLSGISAHSVVSNKRAQFTENILFTHRGLSGPAILQLSSYWLAGEEIMIDLLPGMVLDDFLQMQKQQQPNKALQSILSELLPRRLNQVFLPSHLAERPVKSLSNQELQQVVACFQPWIIRPNGTEGYRTAEVTVGGVDCDALSSKTMEAMAVRGLYFIGEVLDVTGWLGGYNFQWAWSSGWAAGQVV